MKRGTSVVYTIAGLVQLLRLLTLYGVADSVHMEHVSAVLSLPVFEETVHLLLCMIAIPLRLLCAYVGVVQMGEIEYWRQFETDIQKFLI